MNCIFCKIINKEIESFILHEDDDFLVILDRFPTVLGHTLIISKNHEMDLFALNARAAANLLPLAQKIGAALKKTLEFDGLNIVQNNGAAAGQTIFHFHMHLIPRLANDNVPIGLAPKDETVENLKILRDKITESFDKEL